MNDPKPDDLMRDREDGAREYPQFDPETHKILLEVADGWRGWKAIGRIVRMGVVFLGTLVAGWVAWDQLMAKVRGLLGP